MFKLITFFPYQCRTITLDEVSIDVNAVGCCSKNTGQSPIWRAKLRTYLLYYLTLKSGPLGIREGVFLKVPDEVRVSKTVWVEKLVKN